MRSVQPMAPASLGVPAAWRVAAVRRPLRNCSAVLSGLLRVALQALKSQLVTPRVRHASISVLFCSVSLHCDPIQVLCCWQQRVRVGLWGLVPCSFWEPLMCLPVSALPQPHASVKAVSCCQTRRQPSLQRRQHITTHAALAARAMTSFGRPMACCSSASRHGCTACRQM